jgi:hypothetical protein
VFVSRRRIDLDRNIRSGAHYTQFISALAGMRPPLGAGRNGLIGTVEVSSLWF